MERAGAPARQAGAATRPAPSTPTAPTAPLATAREALQRARQLAAAGETDQALEAVKRGLELDPRDLDLLLLRASLLLERGDKFGALAAYEAYLAANPPAGAARSARRVVRDLEPVRTTALEVVLTNGPARIFIDSRARGEVCVAAPTCVYHDLEGTYKVFAERDGFENWTGKATLTSGTTTRLTITLVEKPSLLTVRAAQPGARVTVDDADFTSPGLVPAGPHKVSVTLADHAPATREITARLGEPIVLDVTLDRLLVARIEPPSATLTLDGKPTALADGKLVVPTGRHRLTGRAKGYDEGSVEIAESASAGDAVTLSLSATRVAAVVATPGMFTPRRKLALAAGGVGVAALGAGIVLGLGARSADRDAFALCPSPSEPCARAAEANDLNERGRSRALSANIAFGVAGAAAVGAAVLWLTGRPETAEAREPRVAITPRLGELGADVALRF